MKCGKDPYCTLTHFCSNYFVIYHQNECSTFGTVGKNGLNNFLIYIVFRIIIKWSLSTPHHSKKLSEPFMTFFCNLADKYTFIIIVIDVSSSTLPNERLT